MPEILPANQPLCVIEGEYVNGRFAERFPLLARCVAEQGITAAVANVNDPATYDKEGLIKRMDIVWGNSTVSYDGEGVLPDAWLLRTMSRTGGDPAAFIPERGCGSRAARRNVVTNMGMIAALANPERGNLGDLVIPSLFVRGGRKDGNLPQGQELFVKPGGLKSDLANHPALRACVVEREEAMTTARKRYKGSAVIQPVLPQVPAPLIAELMNVSSDGIPMDSFHAIRLGAVLTKDTPAFAELRVTTRSDIGKHWPSQSRLVSAETALAAMPELARANERVVEALRRIFGSQNSLAMDYIMTKEGVRLGGMHLLTARPKVGNPSSKGRLLLASRREMQEAELLASIARASRESK